MKKGTETRQQMLDAAESLFCAKGYEATSIQDILDRVHGSKGGFYHHFATKEAVLRELCETRATEAAAQARETLFSIPDDGRSVGRLNTLFHHILPMRPENAAFMAMLLPTLDRAEGLTVRVAYQEALSAAFLPIVRAEITKAASTGLLAPAVPEPERPVMLLLNACWVDVALLLLREEREGAPHEPANLVDTLAVWRKSVELLLDAPYGSIDLLPVDTWEKVAQAVAERVRLQQDA